MSRKTVMGTGATAIILSIAACGGSATVYHGETPRPTVTVTGHEHTLNNYAQNIINAGINGPVDWIIKTGERLCAEWRSGSTTADTDPILLAGGVHAEHLDAFNRITNNDLCPDVTPSTPPTYHPGTSNSYAQDIINAGINGPVDWIYKTGRRLCTEWRSGKTTSETDQILLSGGVHGDHLEAFNRITNDDLCPDVTPSP